MLVPGQNPGSQRAGPGPSPGSKEAEIPWNDAAQLALSVAVRFFGHRKRQVAEDIAQEAVLRLFRNAAKVRTAWRPFLTTIVLNVARTHLQKEKVRKAAVSTSTEATEHAVGPKAHPLDRANIEEGEALLKDLVQQLDQRFGRGTAAIVDLRAQDVQWEEIVKIVGLKERACSYRHRKATTWLCSRLSLQGGETAERRVS